MSVTRYDLHLISHLYNPVIKMEPDADGEWVGLASCAKLEAKLDRLRGVLEGIIEAADIGGYSTERGLLSQRVSAAHTVLQEAR